MGDLRGVDAALTRKIAHGRRAVEAIAKLRPDLDSEAELKVIEDIEVEDNEGLSVLPGVRDLLAALPLDRWTVVTSATERLARIRLAAAGIPFPDSSSPPSTSRAASLTPSRSSPEPLCSASHPLIASSLKIRLQASMPAVPPAAPSWQLPSRSPPNGSTLHIILFAT